jgi:hypothetical protein
MRKPTPQEQTQRRHSQPAPTTRACQKKVAATIAAMDQLEVDAPKAAKIVSLLKNWLADDSGYDENAWPQLKKALNRERDRVGARRLFDE